MRTKGKITIWKAEKGYGFITPESGANQVFVHINSFADKSQRPQINQLVSFSLSTDKQGRPCAVNVTRLGEKARKPKQNKHTFWTVKSALKLFIILTFAGAFAYSKYQKSRAGSPLPLKSLAPSSSMTTPQPQFSCDGRTHCSHMTSCAEAKYFIQNCPNTKMDGDGDGIPCESQWCN